MTGRSDVSALARMARILSLMTLVVAALAIAGCGSDDDAADEGAGSTGEITAVSVDQAAADLVPQAIRDGGTLTVAMDASYAPNEFFDEDGKTIIGMDSDLATAIGQTLDLSVEKQNVTFDAILPGLAANKYEIAISSFTDTKEREKTVDMVTYFTAGTGFYTNAENPTDVETVADLCGKTVAVQKGTVQQEDVEAQNEKCDKPINVEVFSEQTDVDLAISSGRADVALADSPVAAYAVKQSDGRLASTGKDYDSAPYGIAVNKDSGMTEAIQKAVQSLIDNGTYAEILDKWGVSGGAIDESKINDGVE
ncbi:MAG: ABC transporter substrate-binding protein [Solirubrobacterales bacterium]